MAHKLSDVGAERAVLAGLFSYGMEAYVEICDIIDVDTFTHKNNQVLYKCVQKILENEVKIDPPAILSAAEQLNLSDVVNSTQELEYINSLIEFPIKKDNVCYFAAQIKKFEFARKIKKLTLTIAKDVENINGDESIDEIINLMESPITDFLREDDGNNRSEKLGKGIDEYLESIMENRCDQVGVSTGYNRYDAAIGGGLRPKCVDLVSARPKVGKSVFGDNVAIHVARQGIPVLMLDTEMSQEDHLNRIISNLSSIPINDVATGKFVDEQEKIVNIQNAVDEIKDMPYNYASVAGKSFDQIMNIIKRWLIQDVGQDENGRTNPCLVVYDYLKLMSSGSISGHIQEYQALGFQITELHNLAVKYDFPCLAFVQLNRDGITRESTDTVSGSDRLVWLCTSFSIFKMKSPEEIAEDGPGGGNRKLVPITSRHGPGMEDGNYINMNMRGEYARLLELRTRDENRVVAQSVDGAIEGADAPFEEEE